MRAAFEARCAMKHGVLLQNTVNVGQGRALVATESQMSSAILFRHNPKTTTGVCVLPDSPKTPRALSTFHSMSVHIYACTVNMRPGTCASLHCLLDQRSHFLSCFCWPRKAYKASGQREQSVLSFPSRGFRNSQEKRNVLAPASSVLP